MPKWLLKLAKTVQVELPRPPKTVKIRYFSPKGVFWVALAPFGSLWTPFWVHSYRLIYAPRIPADLLKRSVWLRSATKLSRRPCLVSKRCRSLGPKGTPGTPPHPKKTPQGTPPGPRGGWGPRALGAVGRDGPMGPLGVIPKPFHTAAKTTHRMSPDLVGFGRI